MVCRVAGVVICFYKTFDCAKTFHHSFFHCDDSDSNSRTITYTFAVIFELVTVFWRYADLSFLSSVESFFCRNGRK